MREKSNLPCRCFRSILNQMYIIISTDTHTLRTTQSPNNNFYIFVMFANSFLLFFVFVPWPFLLVFSIYRFVYPNSKNFFAYGLTGIIFLIPSIFCSPFFSLSVFRIRIVVHVTVWLAINTYMYKITFHAVC